MGVMRKVAIGVAWLVGFVVLAAAGFYAWAAWAAATKLNVTYDVHRVDFPIPFPLTASELDALRAERLAAAPAGAANPAAETDPLAGLDLNAVARERAVARGKHLVESLYVCTECHASDFGGGGVMVDDAMIGHILGPNLTLGKGSRTLNYTAADWDRMVRHGVKPDGKASPMPSKDFFGISDQELSDIVSYIRSFPNVDREVPVWTSGPLGKVLVATGQIELSAAVHPTKHVITHLVVPPAAAPDATYGKHLAQACTGCHRSTFVGGPIAGGPPDWPPAANLTPTGLAGWTYEDFLGALLHGKRKTGEPLREPMASMPKFAKNLTDTELKAIWAFIQSLPAAPDGK